jgi:hypothetical protein
LGELRDHTPASFTLLHLLATRVLVSGAGVCPGAPALTVVPPVHTSSVGDTMPHRVRAEKTLVHTAPPSRPSPFQPRRRPSRPATRRHSADRCGRRRGQARRAAGDNMLQRWLAMRVSALAHISRRGRCSAVTRVWPPPRICAHVAPAVHTPHTTPSGRGGEQTTHAATQRLSSTSMPLGLQAFLSPCVPP